MSNGQLYSNISASSDQSDKYEVSALTTSDTFSILQMKCVFLKQPSQIHWFLCESFNLRTFKSSHQIKSFSSLKPQAHLCHREQGLKEPYITLDAMQRSLQVI